MTFRDWESPNAATFSSSQLWSASAWGIHPPNGGTNPPNETPSSVRVQGSGERRIQPINGLINGKSVLGYNEGVIEVWFLSDSTVGIAGSVYMYFKVTGSTHYSITAGTGHTLRRNGANIASGGTRTIQYRKWQFMRAYFWWLDAAHTKFRILTQGDNGDGSGVSNFLDYTDTSPIADSSTCTIGLGLDGGSPNVFFAFFDSFRMRPKPTNLAFL